MQLFSIVLSVGFLVSSGLVNDSFAGGRLSGRGFDISLRFTFSVGVGDLHEVSVAPGEETSEDSTDDSSKEVGADEAVFDGSGGEKLDGHHVVGDSDSGVDGSTGVGSSTEDHSAESHGDSEDTEHAFIFQIVGGEIESFSILADEVGHGEDASSDDL